MTMSDTDTPIPMRRLDALPGAPRYVDLATLWSAHGRDIRRLPYSLRVLAENVARHADTNEGAAALAALLRWPERVEGAALPLHTSRVILPDSSGLPVLLDLAAMRDALARAGLDPRFATPDIPVDLIVDHSLQVDYARRPDAIALNLGREFERNDERYRFIKWAQAAFSTLRVFPPGTGIIHQINLEHLATVITEVAAPEGPLAHPEFVLGGDSHTPMINALGIVGWGVGGLDAEAVLLGLPHYIAVPEVVGVRLVGALPAGSTTTDLALLVTQRLRAHGVTGRFVEYFGPAVASLAVPERASLSNMAPEYGATVGFFAVDENTLLYLRGSGRSDAVLARVEAYCRANAMYRDAGTPDPHYDAIVEIDLADAVPTMAGPRRPQDRLPLAAIAGDFRERLARPFKDGGYGIESGAATPAADGLAHGSIVVAAITSCTNTSNPSVMIAAGLVAQKAHARGIKPPAWVKTSLAPGSQIVPGYLRAAGLLEPLEALGFHVIGYGCTTCAGKSGPLDPEVVQTIERDNVVGVAVLSGNRNFEGRIHRLARANYIGAPPLVVAYALAGRIDLDLTSEALAIDAAGKPVYLADLWPTRAEIDAYMALVADPARYHAVYDTAEAGPKLWQELRAAASERFPWDPASTYLVAPPFVERVFDGDALPQRLDDARVLAAFGDSLTTDHISPSGEIPRTSAAGRYLIDLGIDPRNFNSYVGRRCNHEVMARGTFANLRIRNLLVEETEGGYTRLFPEGTEVGIHDAASAYRKRGTPLLVLGGRDYGTGSSRDWAAKGAALLGVRAVLAESFERIHRSNLVSMGVLPLKFAAGEGWRQLGLRGDECYALSGLREAVESGTPVTVAATGDRGTTTFAVTAEIHSDAERAILRAGGLLPSVFDMLAAKASAERESA
jgi:aconitate hydratase